MSKGGKNKRDRREKGIERERMGREMKRGKEYVRNGEGSGDGSVLQ